MTAPPLRITTTTSTEPPASGWTLDLAARIVIHSTDKRVIQYHDLTFGLAAWANCYYSPPPAPPLADDVAKHIARTRKVIAATKAQYIQHGTQPPLTVKTEQSLEWIERLVARAEKAEAEVARLREALVLLNDKALMNAGEFAKYVRAVTAAAEGHPSTIQSGGQV